MVNIESFIFLIGKKVVFLTAAIVALVPIAALLLQYFGNKRDREKDVSQDSQQKTQLFTQLDYISKTLEELRVDIRASDRQRESMSGDIIRLQEFQRRSEYAFEEQNRRIAELEKIHVHKKE